MYRTPASYCDAPRAANSTPAPPTPDPSLPDPHSLQNKDQKSGRMGEAVRRALSRGGRPCPVSARGVALPSTCQQRPPSQGLRASAHVLTSAGPRGATDLQAGVPVLLVQPEGGTARLPAIVFMHGTGASAADLWPWMEAVAGRGVCCLAVDARYHGQRSGGNSREAYEDALVAAWRGSGERPFLLDTVDDLLSLVLGWLEEQPGVDGARIGVTGISLGGMMAVLAAAADERIAAVAPLIGTQGFGWAVQNRSYQERVASIPRVFTEAAQSMTGDKARITPEVVAAVWDRLLPGMLESYDSHDCLPCIAPRALCIVNGALDPRCPMEGLSDALRSTRDRYAVLGCPERFDCWVEEGVAHECTRRMQAVATAWLLHALGVEVDPNFGAGGAGGARFLSDNFVEQVEKEVLTQLPL